MCFRPPTMTSERICSKCGEIVEDTTLKECPQCGEPLADGLIPVDATGTTVPPTPGVPAPGTPAPGVPAPPGVAAPGQPSKPE